MTRQTCFLTTKDFTILEVMRDRCLGRDDPLAPILKRKIESATVMFRDDIPFDVATLSSRVTFSVNGRDPDTRIISPDRTTLPIGMFLSITMPHGLALLGLCEGSEFAMTDVDGRETRVKLHEVLYQPESARRAKETMARGSAVPSRKPTLQLIQGALHNQPGLVRLGHDGTDNPGPSAA